MTDYCSFYFTTVTFICLLQVACLWQYSHDDVVG